MSTTNPTWPDPGLEHGPPQWEAGDWPPELWHGLMTKKVKIVYDVSSVENKK
jgi:hypothetical protein